GDDAPWLDDDWQTGRAHFLDEGSRVRVGRGDVALLVGDAESAAEVQVLERRAGRGKIAAQRRGDARRAAERFDGRNLRADVHVDRHELERGPIRGPREQHARLVERHAELVDLEPRRNVRMALGVDVGVYAN